MKNGMESLKRERDELKRKTDKMLPSWFTVKQLMGMGMASKHDVKNPNHHQHHHHRAESCPEPSPDTNTMVPSQDRVPAVNMKSLLGRSLRRLCFDLRFGYKRKMWTHHSRKNEKGFDYDHAVRCTSTCIGMASTYDDNVLLSLISTLQSLRVRDRETAIVHANQSLNQFIDTLDAGQTKHQRHHHRHAVELTMKRPTTPTVVQENTSLKTVTTETAVVEDTRETQTCPSSVLDCLPHPLQRLFVVDTLNPNVVQCVAKTRLSLPALERLCSLVIEMKSQADELDRKYEVGSVVAAENATATATAPIAVLPDDGRDGDGDGDGDGDAAIYEKKAQMGIGKRMGMDTNNAKHLAKRLKDEEAGVDTHTSMDETWMGIGMAQPRRRCTLYEIWFEVASCLYGDVSRIAGHMISVVRAINTYSLKSRRIENFARLIGVQVIGRAPNARQVYGDGLARQASSLDMSETNDAGVAKTYGEGDGKGEDDGDGDGDGDGDEDIEHFMEDDEAWATPAACSESCIGAITNFVISCNAALDECYCRKVATFSVWLKLNEATDVMESVIMNVDYDGIQRQPRHARHQPFRMRLLRAFRRRVKAFKKSRDLQKKHQLKGLEGHVQKSEYLLMNIYPHPTPCPCPCPSLTIDRILSMAISSFQMVMEQDEREIRESIICSIREYGDGQEFANLISMESAIRRHHAHVPMNLISRIYRETVQRSVQSPNKSLNVDDCLSVMAEYDLFPEDENLTQKWRTHKVLAVFKLHHRDHHQSPFPSSSPSPCSSPFPCPFPPHVHLHVHVHLHI